MPTYNETKQKYEDHQSGIQQGLQQAASSTRRVGGAIDARDEESLVNSASDLAGALVGLGINSARASRQNAKIEAVSQAIKTGKMQMEQGLYEDAIGTATRHLVANEIVEARVNGYCLRGAAYLNSEKYDKAIEDLTEGIRIVETSGQRLDQDALGDVLALSYYFRGQALDDQDKKSDALRDFTKAIQLTPGWEYLYSARGSVLRAIGEYERALSDFSQAISIQPGDADYYRQRARVYALMASPTKAIEDFNKAIALQQNSINLRARGQYYADRQEWQKALNDYTDALAFNQNDAETLKSRAGLLESMGFHSDAQADLLRASEVEKRQDAYQRYLKAAKATYGKGVTKAWAEADSRAKPNYPVAILLGIVTLIVSFGLLMLLQVFWQPNPVTAIIILGLPPIFAIAVIIDRIKEPKLRAKNAKQYFDEMTACEEQMPRFSDFY